MRRLLPLLLLAVGCTADTVDEPEIAVVQTLELMRNDDGVSQGWDLDGVVTDDTEPTGCYLDDALHPDGTPGIDNSFGALLPALEATQGLAIHALIQASVDSGELLLMLEVDDRGDGCRDFHIRRGSGAPAIGGHGKILPGQTYDIDPELPSFSKECGADDNGRVVRVDEFALRLPLNIFDESLDLTLLDGKVEVHRRDGGYRGVFAGGVSTAEIRANLALIDGIGDDVRQLVETATDNRADLLPDAQGYCNRISVGFTFDAVSAYVFE